MPCEIFSLDDGKAREIIDCLIDWMDSNDGDGEEEYGVESSYYQSLESPYSAQNGPMEFVEELLLVKGISPELLYGGNGRPPLASLLTVQDTEGKININTADPLILQALHEEMSKEFAETLKDFRDQDENKELLSENHWYNKVPSFPGDIEIDSDVITVKSTHFIISAQAQQAEVKDNLYALIKREKGLTTLLNFLMPSSLNP